MTGFSLAIHALSLGFLLFLAYTCVIQSKQISLLRLGYFRYEKKRIYLEDPVKFLKGLSASLRIPCRIQEDAIRSNLQNINIRVVFDFLCEYGLSLVESSQGSKRSIVFHPSQEVVDKDKWTRELSLALGLSVTLSDWEGL